jgi:hypothetical protein
LVGRCHIGIALPLLLAASGVWRFLRESALNRGDGGDGGFGLLVVDGFSAKALGAALFAVGVSLHVHLWWRSRLRSMADVITFHAAATAVLLFASVVCYQTIMLFSPTPRRVVQYGSITLPAASWALDWHPSEIRGTSIG